MQTRLKVEKLEDRLVPATNQEYVSSAVLALANRPFNASTDQQFVTAQDTGAQSITQVALNIENSGDGLNFQITQLYQRLLLRTPTAAEIAPFVTSLQGGALLQDVQATIMSSSEYFQFSGGTNDLFLQAVFADQLGRSVDPTGQAFFGGELNNAALGTEQARRQLVATQVIQSPEGALKETLVVFNHYLLRQADLQGLTFFGSQLINSPLFGGRVTDERNIIASLVGSQEFFDASSPT